jgi:hypothetical protein
MVESDGNDRWTHSEYGDTMSPALPSDIQIKRETRKSGIIGNRNTVAQFGRCEFQYRLLASVGRAFVANFGIVSTGVWVDRFIANFSINSARVCA